MSEGYQGESLVFLRTNGGDYGILNFAWGSCCVCDELEACETYEALDDLRRALYAKIHFDSSEDGGHAIAAWWMNRDVVALEAVDRRLNHRFVKLLEAYMEF